MARVLISMPERFLDEIDTVAYRFELENSDFMSVLLKYSQPSDRIFYFRNDGLLYLTPEQGKLSFFKDILYLDFYSFAFVTEIIICEISISKPLSFTEQCVDIIPLGLGHSGEVYFHLKSTAEHILTAFSCRFTCLFDLLILGKSVHDICSKQKSSSEDERMSEVVIFPIHLRWIPPTSSFVDIIIHNQRNKSNELVVQKGRFIPCLKTRAFSLYS